MSKKLTKKQKQKILSWVVTLCIIAVVAVILYFNPDVLKNLKDNGNINTNTGSERIVSTLDGDIKYNPDINLDDGLRVHYIDVGQGDSIYIEFPNGEDMLIDGGSTANTKNERLCIDGDKIANKNSEIVKNYIAKYNDDTVIDYLLVTHADSDHYNYLYDVFEDYEIKLCYLPFATIDFGLIESSPAQEKLFRGGKKITTKGYTNLLNSAFNEPNCKINCLLGNFNIKIDEDILFHIFSLDKYEYESYKVEDNNNEMSPICVLECNKRKLVFAGDAETKSEADYNTDCGNKFDCDVLKVGHHGSKSSSSDDFLNNIKCEYAIISAGETKKYGHPHNETLEKFESRNMQYFCTITYGTIVLKIDDMGNMQFVSAKQVKVNQ